MSGVIAAIGAHAFLRNALLAGLLASIGCGITGAYVVVKRISYIAGGIAHSVFGGMGIAHYLGLPPMGGAIAAALLAALTIGWVSLHIKQQEDTIIGALWAIGMATGVLFMSLTPGYNADLMSTLFGNILLVTDAALLQMFCLDIIIVGTVMLFYRQFLAVVFDEEFARARGINTEVFYLLLLCLVALTVVLLIRIVGLILVIALLTLPTAMARLGANNLKRIMFTAVLIGAVFTTGGILLSYLADWPSGAVIILLMGAGYLIALLGTTLLSSTIAVRKD